VCFSASLENRMIEYVEHLHEHFVDPYWAGNKQAAVSSVGLPR
jgi:hypothetical protein